MLTKFISVLETHFQNTEIAHKNQQALIQGLETQIGQLAKLISERPQEPRQGIEVSQDKGEVVHSEQKMVSKEYKPRMPYPNATRKDRTDEQFGELTLHVGDETITLQARNSSNTSKIEGGCINHSTSTDHVVKPSVQKTISKSAYELCSNNDKGPIYEERRLQIEELDEWQTHRPRTHDKSKSSKDELNTSSNQLKVGDKVLLDAADPLITTSEPNKEIPLTVLSIFPYGTVEVIHPKFRTFKVNNTCLKPYIDKVDSRDEECKLLEPS
ncbi:hypothetical protein GOBAR_AA01664 [Gossypium barbadense]|uniref:Uncharacterized protein n=1 Tax=Gossypium barbadense TaxID=3634 RepID=A0A2P5YTL2_GOSBA|nr:hypothetical protein GOBAR_AA01664 [Gossypium barbadense]